MTYFPVLYYLPEIPIVVLEEYGEVLFGNERFYISHRFPNSSLFLIIISPISGSSVAP
jgi:hypothetical protein